MPLFKKKPPPVWFVLRPAKRSSPNSEPKREGPYTRATITQMYGEGMLGDGALIWTNEKIFPNAQKPSSFRLVRIMEWRRLDQLPDPVVRQLDKEWQETRQQQHAPAQQNSPHHENSETPHAPSTPAQGYDGPSPPTGGTAVQPKYTNPIPSSVYPAGVNINQNQAVQQDTDHLSSNAGSVPTSPPPPPHTSSWYSQTSQQSHAQPPYPQNAPPHQPSSYPASAAYPPPPAPGAY